MTTRILKKPPESFPLEPPLRDYAVLKARVREVLILGRDHLARFQDLEKTTPVIVTTSKLLTTGVDVPTCKNVILYKVINSMVDFKQIIGRGTRVRSDYSKLSFNILDYTGSATRLFADPAFDGEPAQTEILRGYGRPGKNRG